MNKIKNREYQCNHSFFKNINNFGNPITRLIKKTEITISPIKEGASL